MARGGCGAGITWHQRIPICVARHKENVTDHSRTTVRRDSCSRVALPRNAKSFAPHGASLLMARRNEKTRQKCDFCFTTENESCFKDKSIEKEEAENPPSPNTVSLFAWRAINVREDLAHDSAQGFVLERSAKRESRGREWRKSFCASTIRKGARSAESAAGMTPLKRCDIIDVWSIAFRTYTDTMSCSAA